MISIVMPAHNEEGYLEPAVRTVVDGLTARGDDFEVIVAQNGSADATSAEAARLAAAYDRVKPVDLPDADYGRALREGFLRARGDVVVNFDVDLVDLDFLDRALTVLSQSDAAVVVGSKRNPESEDNRGAARRLVTATFALVLRHGFSLRISDTHGLKALRRAPLEPLVAECRFGKDIFDTELIIRAERAGLLVEEIPVAVTDTRPPRTPIARRIPRTLAGLARLWLLLRHSDS
ncbi:MAG TPA: glycosyltransferase [Acidimicrobiales bacterium]|nr:glycosyltransferase [Acidimicrobiales bacterium]